MKFTLEIELDQLVITDGVKGIGSQVASVLRDAVLDHLGKQTSGTILDWDSSEVGKWQIQPEESLAVNRVRDRLQDHPEYTACSCKDWEEHRLFMTREDVWKWVDKKTSEIARASRQGR